MMRIIATLVKAKELEPGDLFSTAGQEYWDTVSTNLSLGEKVYLRTSTPTPADQAEVDIYKVTIEK